MAIYDVWAYNEDLGTHKWIDEFEHENNDRDKDAEFKEAELRAFYLYSNYDQIQISER